MKPLFFLLILSALASSAFAAAEADVLVAYDNSFSDGVGGDDNAEVIAANAIAGSNAINDRSGTGARMRIAGYHKTWFQGGRSTLGGYVGWLGNYGDGYLDDVTAAADVRGADLVSYVCAPNAGETSAAVANQPGRYGAYGTGSFWSNIIAHETGGHNYGADHRGGDDNPVTIMMHNYCNGGSQGFYSNPNIWLNGSRLQGTGSCIGDAVNGGDNAYVMSTTAQGVADRYARVITAPKLDSVVRRWSFNQPPGNAPAGTTVTDAVTGTALATVQGTGATFTGNGLRIPGGTGASGAAYVQLPVGLISGYTNVTLEIWAKTVSVQNWARVLDFNNGTGNFLLLSSSRGNDLNLQRFESKAAATVTLDSDIPTAAGVMYHYAVTFASTGASTGRWTWFRDGDAIAWLDVAYSLATFPDVNNWLGRSAFAGDNYANVEYAEVRVSNIAMSRDQLAANARLGPNRVALNANLTADDPIGQNSFNVAGRWSDSLAPSAGKTYETYGFRLRTPPDGTSRTFAGQSLTLNGGGLTWKGTSSNTITINNLTLGGTDGEVLHAGAGTWTLAGTMDVKAPEVAVRAGNGPINLSANLSGNGSLMLLNDVVTFSGNNAAYTGRTIVGDGRFSRISIDSEARLGANPATFTADQLTFNRGVLFSNTTMTIDDANRGIRIGESAALFNVAPGTTLTLAVPTSGPSSGANLLTAPQFPNPVSGMFIKENTGTLVLTHPNNSSCGEIVISGGTLAVTGAGRINNGNHHMPTVNNGTLLLDTTANQIFGGAISGNGLLIKNNSGMTTLTGANTFTGAVTINGGSLYANSANAATNRALSGTSGITVNTGAILRTSANALFGWNGTQEKPVTVNAGATLLADGGATGDVGVGLITLAGGTLSSTAASTVYGTWRFDDATDKLLVTQDSTASATNVKFGNAAASIEVAAGKTLNFTGTITNATSGGTSFLTKTGTGTLILAGTNTYTGATAVNQGTLVVNGNNSGATGVMTVAANATLGGNGNLGGNVTIAANGIHSLTLAATPGAQVTRSITGTLTNAAGNILNLTAASAPAAGVYTLVTATGGISALPTTVTGFTGGVVSISGNSLILTVSNSAYDAWALSKGLTGANNGATQDNGDFDDVPNILEFVLDGNPLASDTGKLPKPSEDSTNFYFDFDRRNDSVAEVALTFEYGTTLASWPSSVAIPSNNYLIAGPPVTITDNGGGTHHLKVTVAKSGNPKLFGRLKAVK